MKILAADTASSVISVALSIDGRLAAEVYVAHPRAHAERILGIADWVLDQAGCKMRDVDAFAISTGPGSFTGIRVGLAAWKGLSFGCHRPLIGVPTLDAMARLAGSSDAIICPLLDARMKEVYRAIYLQSNGERTKLAADKACPPLDAIRETLDLAGERRVIFLGDGAIVFGHLIAEHAPSALVADAALGIPRAGAVAAEAATLSPCDPGLIQAVYLRKSQPEEARMKAAAQGG